MASASKKIPPLAWIIVALLVVVVVVALVQHRGTYSPPNSPSTPLQQPAKAPVMPQAPAVQNGPAPAPAPNGSGPTNQPGVQTGPAPSGNPS